MPHLFRFLSAATLALVLAACGGDEGGGGGGGGGGAPDQSTPEATVKAYFEAAKTGDKEAMLALGTAKWQEKEKTWKKGFTLHIADKGFRVKEYQARPPRETEEGVRISTGVVFTLPDGKEDKEGMGFLLVKEGDVWKIADLR